LSIGVQAYSASMTADYTSTRPLTIGAPPGGGSEFLFGYISNLRIVKGTALYTANFTPPTANLTAITNTSLLTCQDATIRDNSTNAFAITSNGDARPVAQSPFTQTTTTVSLNNIGSGYFDGTGDYLSLPSNPMYAFAASEDYTVECWVNFSTVQTCAFWQATNNISSASGQFWFGYESGALKSSQIAASAALSTFATSNEELLLGASFCSKESPSIKRSNPFSDALSASSVMSKVLR